MSSWSEKLFWPIAIGSIGLIHYVWWKIQQNPNFVPPQDRKPHPFIAAALEFSDYRKRKALEKERAANSAQAGENLEEEPKPKRYYCDTVSRDNMPIYRFWRLRKLIRDTTAPIPLATAKKWDTILGRIYNVSVLGMFCCLMHLIFEHNKEKEAEARRTGIPTESSAEYWIRKMEYKNATLFRVGSGGVSKREYQDGELVKIQGRPVKKANVLPPVEDISASTGSTSDIAV
ncbi:uncharacterized protein LOC129581691 [Paramacrobiotus metropolitanus]|uniref:uncharacterized protein LOC129581691 n=1 Tax=Paramacrobiotus metropolitanus TaxID=2943436 RepID=UPI002445E895|nr:uncharacterized protein LOC129581691 [Paramacrobiotus metropolitanus]